MYDAGKVGLTMEGLHDSTRTYEKLSVVTNTAKTKLYISKKNVPSGVALTNTEYWEESMNNNSVSLDWEFLTTFDAYGDWTESFPADTKYEYLAVEDRGMSVKINTEYENRKTTVHHFAFEGMSVPADDYYFTMQIEQDEQGYVLIELQYYRNDSTDNYSGAIYRRPITEHLLEPEEA